MCVAASAAATQPTVRNLFIAWPPVCKLPLRATEAANDLGHTMQIARFTSARVLNLKRCDLCATCGGNFVTKLLTRCGDSTRPLSAITLRDARSVLVELHTARLWAFQLRSRLAMSAELKQQ